MTTIPINSRNEIPLGLSWRWIVADSYARATQIMREHHRGEEWQTVYQHEDNFYFVVEVK